jgi:hypothetical protein
MISFAWYDTQSDMAVSRHAGYFRKGSVSGQLGRTKAPNEPIPHDLFFPQFAWLDREVGDTQSQSRYRGGNHTSGT